MILHLRDVNDNDPQFDKTSSSVTLSEDAAVGSLVDNFGAKDPDGGGQGAVSFRIERGSDVRRHFHISDEGMVTVQRPLDRETNPIHKVRTKLLNSTFGVLSWYTFLAVLFITC